MNTSPCRAIRRRRHPARSLRGTVLIYCIVAFTTLSGFVSLGVDLGRAQLAKTELQRAADAAARYAAQGVSDGTYLSKAQAAASANTVDSTPLTLLASDVTLGTWSNGAFTAGGANPNAVRVVAVRSAARGTAVPLLFAQVIGIQSCNVTATTIARNNGTSVGKYCIASDTATTFVSGKTDSYDSSSGAYSAATAGSSGDITSNGTVSLTGSPTKIKGDVEYATTYTSLAATVTGTVTKLTTPNNYPDPTPPAAGSYTYYGTQSIASGTTTLSGGTYYVDNFTMSGGTYNFTGPTTLYINGSITLSGGQINTYQNKAANLRIINLSNNLVSVANTPLTADLYAPNSTINLSGTSTQLYGRMVGKSVSLTNSSVHYDTGLLTVPSLADGGISIVR